MSEELQAVKITPSNYI